MGILYHAYSRKIDCGRKSKKKKKKTVAVIIWISVFFLRVNGGEGRIVCVVCHHRLSTIIIIIIKINPIKGGDLSKGTSHEETNQRWLTDNVRHFFANLILFFLGGWVVFVVTCCVVFVNWGYFLIDPLN